MTRYTQYTLTSSNQVPILYECSNCKKINSFCHKVTGKSIYNDRGLFVNLEKRKERAAQIADANRNTNHEGFLNKLLTNNYSSAKLNQSCPNCRNEEPWSNMNWKYSTTPSVLAFIFGVPALFFSSIGEAYSLFVLFLGIICTTIITDLIINKISHIIAYIKISRLSHSNLPFPVFSESDIKEFYNNCSTGNILSFNKMRIFKTILIFIVEIILLISIITVFIPWYKDLSTEYSFSESVKERRNVYAEITTIEPIYSLSSEYYLSPSKILCKCNTTDKSNIWVLIHISAYNEHFDSNAEFQGYGKSQHANKRHFSSPKKIYGKSKSAESIETGLSDKLNSDIVFEFKSVE